MPGQRFVKTWRFRNDRKMPWPEQVEAVFVGGDDALVIDQKPVPVRGSVEPGQEVDVSVDLIGPSEPGTYQAFYRLREVTTGRKFGQRVWANVSVPAPSSESDDFVDVDAFGPEDPFPDAYNLALAQLQEMGFQDRPLNQRLLSRYHGNVERVLAKLNGETA